MEKCNVAEQKKLFVVDDNIAYICGEFSNKTKEALHSLLLKLAHTFGYTVEVVLTKDKPHQDWESTATLDILIEDSSARIKPIEIEMYDLNRLGDLILTNDVHYFRIPQKSLAVMPDSIIGIKNGKLHYIIHNIIIDK